MANDPNRDLLPVKEDSRAGKGFSGKFDHLILGKLSRCELEDRFLRLLDEQTHIKKLANSQEEKIKRLGTKLLRLINEKKSGKKFSDPNKEPEDLHLRIIELEHENYSLKDKNTVLKQQLASHSRHHSTHRSPNCSNHTSPLLTVRRSVQTIPNESGYDPINKNITTEMQLHEAEAHIRELNDEIKSLHNKIDYLQQNLEKNNLDNRKTKVTENIELIRLQRSLKQQAIQIAALQAQVKNSEKTQKILKEELVKAHNENDDALHLISVKQNEILTLCTKLEEKNLNRLEEDELKERINDLVMERDNLKERSDFLMRSICAKAEESEKICELQRLLAEEKCKKEKLEEDLVLLKNNNMMIPPAEGSEAGNIEKMKTAYLSQQSTPFEKKETSKSPSKADVCSESFGSSETSLNQDVESDTDRERPETCEDKLETRRKICPSEGKYEVEKMKLELELQYLREMLRSQTLRCESQQAEISRLMFELKLNEEKCSETLQRLDWHLKIFESFEMRAHQNPPFPKPERIEKKVENNETLSRQESFKPKESQQSSMTFEKEVNSLLSSRESVSKTFVESKRRIESISDDNFPSKLDSPDIRSPPVSTNESLIRRQISTEHKKRFVEQTFLESSDEEYDGVGTSRTKPHLLESEEQDEENDNLSKRRALSLSNSSIRKKKSSSSVLSEPNSDSNLHSRRLKSKKDKSSPAKKDSPEYYHTVTISIFWFKIRTDSPFWKNEKIEMFFIDFIFLSVHGVETETPQSVYIRNNFDKKFEFNFTRSVNILGSNVNTLQTILKNQEGVVLVFNLVSDSEHFDGTNEECKDFGFAEVTSKEFLNFCNKGPFQIAVKGTENKKEVIGTLSVSIEITHELLGLLKQF